MTGTLHEDLCTFMVSLNSSWNEKHLRQKLQTKSKHTLYVQNPFPENCAVYGIVWKETL